MGNYCKIIIIDDEFIMRQGMKHMLDWEKEGFQIVGEATNGQEGLDLMEKTRPDIVLSDIVMPVLDGIEFSAIVQQKYPEVQLIVLSSYDKFEYVKTTLMNGAIDYILKPTLNPEILLKTLNRAVRKIPGFNLVKSSQASPAAQIAKTLTGYQEHLDEAAFAEVFPYTLFRLTGVNLKHMCNGKKENMARIEEKTAIFFDEKSTYVSIPVFIDEEILCYVHNYRVKDEKIVMADIETRAAQVAAIHSQAFFTAGKSFSNMQEIKSHYQTEIRPYVNRRFYYPGRYLLSVQGSLPQEKEERFAFEKYTAHMVHGQFEPALSMFTEYVRYMCHIQIEEYKMKNLTKNLLYNYLIEAENHGISGEELKDKYFELVDKSDDVEQFLGMTDAMEAELNKLRGEKMELEDAEIVSIKNYISEHYAEELSLADLADKFGFSYHYLSSYFNKQTKAGFSEYLNMVRVEKACSLLAHSEHTISEVSSLSGYSDHTYFCRIFKKTTGDTPSQYRRMHRS